MLKHNTVVSKIPAGQDRSGVAGGDVIFLRINRNGNKRIVAQVARIVLEANSLPVMNYVSF
jgi:hypothetical protein